jgi:shikimate kinase
MRIFLIGPMGSGKTTVGAALAKRLQRQFVDLDRHIEKREGLTISMLFQQYGEEYFRQCESEVLHTIIQSASSAVIATGGGTPCFHNNMTQMNAAGVTIYLQCAIEKLQARTEGTSNERPILRQPDFSLENLLKIREPEYTKAQHKLNNDATINSAVDAILELLKTR